MEERTALRELAFIAAGSVVVLLLSGTPALATPSDKKPQVSIVNFDEAAIVAKSQRAARLGVSETKARNKLHDHLDYQARHNRLVDEQNVQIATLPDPFSPGKEIVSVWDGPKAPSRIMYSKRTNPSGSTNTAMGVQFGDGQLHGVPTVRPNVAAPGAVSGYGNGDNFGYNNLILPEGQYGCGTQWFTPTYWSDGDHKMIACYEAWELNGTPVFVYNRWTEFTKAEHVLYPFQLTAIADMEVASRPWRGYEWTIYQLANWAPHSDELNGPCGSPLTLGLEAGWGAINATLSIPINRCSDLRLNNIAGPGTENRILIDYDGFTTGNQITMDIAGKYQAINSTVLPVWADKNYVEVFTWGGWEDAYSEYWSKTDSGWY